MIEGMIALASYTNFGSGVLGNTLAQWQQAGLFDYVLPFIIIFALVFGLLTRMKMFGESSTAVNAIIALAIGLISLQSNYVSSFFSEVFPRFGVGLGILLVALILLGMFVESKSIRIFLVLGIVVAIIVFSTTFNALSWGNYDVSTFFAEFGPLIVLIAMVIAVISSVGSSSKSDSLLAKSLLGNN